jgi:hypothetical protein
MLPGKNHADELVVGAYEGTGQLNRTLRRTFVAGALLVAPVVGAIGLASPVAAAPYPPGTCSLAVSQSTVTAGTTVTVSTTNCSSTYAPGASVDLIFTSDPVSLGTTTANGAGLISQAVTIPANAVNGAHTITATGAAAAGGTLTLSVGITVASSGSSNGLAFTGGSDTLPLVFAAVAALTAGAALVIGSRRRSVVRARRGIQA